MSKNKKANFSSDPKQGIEAMHQEEYKMIKSDLVKVGILNLVYLVGMLALFYYNQQTGFLEKTIGKFIHL